MPKWRRVWRVTDAPSAANSHLLSLQQASVPSDFCLNLLSCFRLISLNALMNIESNMKPSSSPADIIPTRLSREIIGAIRSNVLCIINSPLSSGCVPDHFKTFCVQLLLREPGLEPHIFKNGGKKPLYQFPEYLSQAASCCSCKCSQQLIHGVFPVLASSQT